MVLLNDKILHSSQDTVGLLSWTPNVLLLSLEYISKSGLEKGASSSFTPLKVFLIGTSVYVCTKQYIWTNSSFLFYPFMIIRYYGKDNLE